MWIGKGVGVEWGREGVWRGVDFNIFPAATLSRPQSEKTKLPGKLDFAFFFALKNDVLCVTSSNFVLFLMYR